ncbi:hypothetical protein Msil_3601 [Methylocella silvestris BL2]|uniref:Uncharacterized protein n=1 Tax=Methylocella silvestris (strain DSM 15510 / CIP 108128 / LMG 27833 / NCIMB 13906 / BL2) TaxID=395965 RepID=B8EIZ4_METSB|nr:hypothetical protein [Methylocella silvestris]ACK52486.1 hypothetical protein Msil_3601 [Methylocella silvestris BL2]
MLSFIKSSALFFSIVTAASAADSGATYLFRVDCRDEAFLARWIPVPGDPDKDYFRSATGTLNLDCSISDYNPKTDRGLPQRICSDPGGIINGFPPALIVAGLTHCN